MPSLLSLDLENYRSLADVSVPLGPLNVIVGPNAAGKSNFLDAIRFLGDSVRQDLVPALDLRGGFDQIRFRGATSGPIRLRVRASVTAHASETAPDEYSLSITKQAIGSSRDGAQRQLIRRYESFKFKRTKGRGRRFTTNGSRIQLVDDRGTSEASAGLSRTALRSDSLALSTLPRLALSDDSEQVRQIGELFSTFRVFDVSVDRARLPNLVESTTRLAHDASNLSAFLLRLSDDSPDLYVELLEDLRHFVPGLRDLVFRRVGGSSDAVVIELLEDAFPTPTPLSQASYGTVRALALLALIYDPAPPRLTCVEEIDHGLHPHVFDVLVERLRWASAWTQFLIVTHSPALVNRLDASELIVCERDPESGETLMPAIASSEVRDLERAAGGELALGELWFSGTLGGGIPLEL